MAISDFQINSRLRSVFARAWIDLPKLKFGSFRGTIRVSGRLCYLGARADQLDAGKLETMESEIRRLPGVNRVYFDLSNWRKNALGQWECLDRASQQVCVTESLETETQAVAQVRSESVEEVAHNSEKSERAEETNER